MARPTDYTDDKAAEICAQIMEGKSLRAICADDAMPDPRTVYRWLGVNEAFRQQYALAREDQADSYADEIVDIADAATTGEEAQIARVRVDSRKWVAAKLKPKKYGDRIAHTGAEGGPIVCSWLMPEGS